MILNKKEIGIFGSAFNPLTKAHQYIIEQAKQQVQQLWLIPSTTPPHKQINASFEQRYNILYDVYQNEILNEKIKILDIDKQLIQQGKIASTYNMLLELGPFKTKPLFFVGEDNKDLTNFTHKEEILNIAKIIQVELPIELSQIRSTLARQILNNKTEALHYISEDVLKHY